MTSDANGVYRGVYTYGEERISVRDLVEVEGVPNDPLYYMYDGRGSVTQLTNAKGNVSDKYRYTPFGEPMSGGKLSPNTKLLNNPYGYNGEYHDLESGFQYLRARYYNPETARFITRDSYLGQINEPLSLNRYAYTVNNPVKYKDPSGNGPQYAGDDIVQQNQIDEAYLRGKSDSSVKNQPLLKYGSRGDSVVKVQSILDELGYDLGSSGVDGVYGYYTEKAMKSYQTANGLQSDGIVGPKTWGSFNSFNIYVNKKAAEARNSSKNSNACDDLGGGVVSGNGAYSPDEPGEAYIKSYDPSKINPLLYMSSRDGNLPHSLQEIIIQYSYEYTKANNTDDKKRALTELEYYRGLGNNPATRKYYEAKDFINREDNKKLAEVLMLYGMVRSGAKTKLLSVERVSKTGSLSNLETRTWYLEQESKIPSMIDKNLSLEQQARQAVDLRNQFRTQARELMADRELAASLYKNDPNLTWEQVVKKYSDKGFSGDALYQEIVNAAQRSRTSVNESLGIKK